MFTVVLRYITRVGGISSCTRKCHEIATESGLGLNFHDVTPQTKRYSPLALMQKRLRQAASHESSIQPLEGQQFHRDNTAYSINTHTETSHQSLVLVGSLIYIMTVLGIG